MTALAHKREESTNMAMNPLPTCSTEGGPPEAAVMRGLKAIVRPVARVVVLAHLALALQPLSALAHDGAPLASTLPPRSKCSACSNGTPRYRRPTTSASKARWVPAQSWRN